MSINKILVAVDFSPESSEAVSQAMDVARHCGAELVLLHVGSVPTMPLGTPDSMAATVSEYYEILQSHLTRDRQQLEELRQRLSGQGVVVSHVVIDGFADRAICDAADQMDADVISLGTHGRTGFKRVVLGSVAEKVVRLSGRDVLVARPGSRCRGGYERICVGTDFSEISERALERALAVAAQGARIDLVHAWLLPPMSNAYIVSDDLAGPVRESIRAAALASGAALVDKYRRPGLALTFHEIEQAAARGLQQWLGEHTYDLAVVGSHGLRGFRRWILGSVAEVTVRHAPCSELVAHGGRDGTPQ